VICNILTGLGPLCRRYFGHKRTIRPNAKRLYPLFLNRRNMAWYTFSSRVRALQKGFMGEPRELKPGRGQFHENPSTCICEKTGGKTVSKSKSQDDQGVNYGAQESEIVSEPAVPSLTDVEEYASAEKEETVVDPEADGDALVGPEDPELEQILSD
jgi:hypothetical protein